MYRQRAYVRRRFSSASRAGLAPTAISKLSVATPINGSITKTREEKREAKREGAFMDVTLWCAGMAVAGCDDQRDHDPLFAGSNRLLLTL